MSDGSGDAQLIFSAKNPLNLGFYLISMWYKRSEAQKRFTLFFTSTQLAGAFGGLLATAIGKMNDIRGYHAWRWIFILEGILTCVIALAAYFVVPDFPEHSSWLSADELALIEARLTTENNGTTGNTPATLSSILLVLKDPKVLLGGLMYFALIVPAYGICTRIHIQPSSHIAKLSFQASPTSPPP